MLLVPDVSKIEMLGAQDERVFVEFSMEQLAGLGIDRSALIAALQAQNVVSPAGTIQTGDEKLLLRVTGAFESEQDLRNINFVANGRMIRLRDIAEIRRGFADPPQPLFRVNGKPAIGLAIAMREGGDILALGRNIEQAMQRITADLPLGITPILVADQPHVVDHAISDFTTSLWQAIAIIMAVSFVSLGMRAGMVVALSIPLTLAVVFPIMQFIGIDLQRISLGALIIALGLLVDDAMTTIDVMTSRLAAGDGKEQAATYAYRTLAMPMLTGSFVTAAGFVPIGFAKSSAGEYTFSIFVGGRHRADHVLVRGRAVRAACSAWSCWRSRTRPSRPSPAGSSARSAVSWSAPCGHGGSPSASPSPAWRLRSCASPLIPRQFFPPSDRPELLVDLRLPQNASIFATDDLAKRGSTAC